MEKQYHLRSIKHNRSSDYLSVSASLYLGHRRIGVLKTCADTEAFIFDFEFPAERVIFENFVTDWWNSADRTIYFGLTEKTIQSANPSYDPSMAVKLCCWIKAMVMPIDTTRIGHDDAVNLHFFKFG